MSEFIQRIILGSFRKTHDIRLFIDLCQNVLVLIKCDNLLLCVSKMRIFVFFSCWSNRLSRFNSLKQMLENCVAACFCLSSPALTSAQDVLLDEQIFTYKRVINPFPLHSRFIQVTSFTETLTCPGVFEIILKLVSRKN